MIAFHAGEQEARLDPACPIYVYGSPINRIDERLPWLTALARKLGLDAGPHLQIAKEVGPLLVAHAAAANELRRADGRAGGRSGLLGAREFHHFQFPMFLAGMAPCFIETSEREAGTVFPLSCEHLAHEGPAKRAWPSA